MIAKIGQPEDPLHLAEVRAILEPEIAALAATRIRAEEQHLATMREAVALMDPQVAIGPGCLHRSRPGFPSGRG